MVQVVAYQEIMEQLEAHLHSHTVELQQLPEVVAVEAVTVLPLEDPAAAAVLGQVQMMVAETVVQAEQTQEILVVQAAVVPVDTQVMVELVLQNQALVHTTVRLAQEELAAAEAEEDKPKSAAAAAEA